MGRAGESALTPLTVLGEGVGHILDAVRHILHCILGGQQGGEVISLPL